MPTSLTGKPYYYFTATSLEQKRPLKQDDNKKIIIDSLRFLVAHERITLYAFAIIPHRIDLLWQFSTDSDPLVIQQGFLSYTSQKIVLQHTTQSATSEHRAIAGEKDHTFWEPHPLHLELKTHAAILQKLHYIHGKPVRAGLCLLAEDYKYSSAKFYQAGIDNWGFLVQYRD